MPIYYRGGWPLPEPMATANTPALSPDIADLIERSERAAPEPLEARERFVELCFAVPVISAAIGIAVGVHAERHFSVGSFLVFLLAYLAAKRIQFAVGAAYTIPTQRVFVPVLYLLPSTRVSL